MRLKDFVTAGLVMLVLGAGVMVAVIAFSDCDLFLLAANHFGKQPESLAGQVVWITGASSGIGEHLAYVLAGSGCKLVLSARRLDQLERVAQTCIDEYKMNPDDVMILTLDLLQFDTHDSAVDLVLQRFGQIDVLVNNAGRSQRALWVETTLEVDRQMLEVNTLGPLSLTKAVLPHMMTRKTGHIAVVSSIVGNFGAPGLGSYSGSKHALHGWFETLRIEAYNDNISVSLLLPGPVFSNALKAAFTGKSGENLGMSMKHGEHRMTTERCARLCAVAIANQLDEAWISLQPELSYLYLNQYLPALANWAAVRVGARRLQKIKEGQHDLHAPDP